MAVSGRVVPTTKQQPMRTCLGCGKRDDQDKLLRLVFESQGELIIDAKGHGRGGYLHYVEKCWQAFLRRKSVYRAFQREISKDVRERLVQRLNEGYGE